MRLSFQACKDSVSSFFFLSLFSSKNVKSILVFYFNCFYRHIFLHFFQQAACFCASFIFTAADKYLQCSSSFCSSCPGYVLSNFYVIVAIQPGNLLTFPGIPIWLNSFRKMTLSLPFKNWVWIICERLALCSPTRQSWTHKWR